MKQKKLIFNFFVNRNWKKLTDSRKRAKILADNRKSHNPIETLLQCISFSLHAVTRAQELWGRDWTNMTNPKLMKNTHALPVPVCVQTDSTPKEAAFRVYMMPLRNFLPEWSFLLRYKRVLMGVPISQLTTIFSAKYQLTTIFLANSQLTTNFG